jgi:2-polyprenyl-3-methyl-5-hydroxy-6-metoxy-1,4-benzoquinol methylase
MPISQKNEIFDNDVLAIGGYVYTTSDQLSSRMATQRTSDIILETECFKNKSVLDMGCGDGFFTIKFFDQGSPSIMIGVDASVQAIHAANLKKGDRQIEFSVGDAHHLPWKDNHFDLVMIQSILHHDDNPGDMIREAFRLAPMILIHEPNGNNLGLKLIEKVSPYHKEHGEKSYKSSQFDRWINEAGGQMMYVKFAGFVPMFCPDWIARFTKWIEPLIEAIPGVRDLICAVVVIVAKKPDQP